MTTTFETRLEAARQRRDELEVALYMDSPEPWERDQLADEWSEQLRIIEDCELRLGLRHWVGYTGRQRSFWRRLRRWARKLVGR